MVKEPVAAFLQWVAFIGITALVGGLVFQAACALYNLVAGALGKPGGRAPEAEAETAITGEPNPFGRRDRERTEDSDKPGVPKPGLEWAMGIVSFSALVNAGGTFIILRLLRIPQQVAWRNVLESPLFILVSLPLGFFVLAGVSTAMLPTRFVKGLVISVIYYLLCFVIGVLVAVVIGLGMALFGKPVVSPFVSG